MRLRSESADALNRIAQIDAGDSAAYGTRRIDAASGVKAIESPAPLQRPRAAALPGRRSGRVLPLSEDTTAAIFRFHASEAKQVIRVMIAVACADGVVDDRERRRIADYLTDAGSTPAEMAYAEDQFRRPAAPQDLARGAASREVASELYAAALLIAAEATPGTRAFLGRLASALRLEPKFVANLHAAWGISQPVPVQESDQPPENGPGCISTETRPFRSI